MVLLPSSFSESPRELKKNFIDSMTIIQKEGKPDLFITLKCNPKGRDIVENLGENETYPLPAVRIFHFFLFIG